MRRDECLAQFTMTVIVSPLLSCASLLFVLTLMLNAVALDRNVWASRLRADALSSWHQASMKYCSGCSHE